MIAKNKNGLLKWSYLAGIMLAVFAGISFSDNLVFTQSEGMALSEKVERLREDAASQRKEFNRLADTVATMNRKLDKLILLQEKEANR